MNQAVSVDLKANWDGASTWTVPVGYASIRVEVEAVEPVI